MHDPRKVTLNRISRAPMHFARYTKLQTIGLTSCEIIEWTQ